MTKLYQVILNVSDYEYSDTKPVFNSLDLDKAVNKALELVGSKFFTNNLFDFSEFSFCDRDFFKNLPTPNNSWNRFHQNIYVIEVELDSDIKDISFRYSKNKIVWQITKEVVENIFIEKIIKLYGDNQFFVTNKEASELFHKVVKDPNNYANNNDAIDEDAKSSDNLIHFHYFDKYEK